jgi:hypothetical protein
MRISDSGHELNPVVLARDFKRLVFDEHDMYSKEYRF